MITAYKWYNVAKSSIIASKTGIKIEFSTFRFLVVVSVEWGSSILTIQNVNIEPIKASVRLRYNGNTWYVDVKIDESFETEELICTLYNNSYWELSSDSTDISGRTICIIDDISSYNNVSSDSLFAIDKEGNLYPKHKEDGAPRGIYTHSFITAGGENEENETIEESLGSLINVREEVDVIDEEKDVLLIKKKTDTHWSAIGISEIVSLDTDALKLYLEENKFINEESLNITLKPIIDKVDYLEKELMVWEKVNIGTEEAPIYALRPKEGIGIISDSFITAGGKNTTTSPGGVTRIEALTDVVIDSPTDGQVLSYDAELQKWVNKSSASGLDEAALQSYLDTKQYATQSWVLSQEYAKKSDLLEIEFNKVFEIVRDSNGNIVSIHALYGLWGDSYITAGGKNNSSTSTIGTLGSLTNVNNSVDAVYDTDVVIYKASGDTHYTVKSISEIGLNEEAIGVYLETNEYITKSYVDTVQSQLELRIGTVSDRLETFLTDVNVDETINSWKELENFLAGYTETATLAELLKVKYDKTGGDIEGDAYVKGSLRMNTLYLPNSSRIPSEYSLYVGTLGTGADIPESGGGDTVVFTPIDSNYGTLSINGTQVGALSINGHTHSQYQLQITTTNKLAYSLISDTPTSLPASDVYDWAKAASKPTYTTSEITEGSNLYFTDTRAMVACVELREVTDDSRYIADVVTTDIIDATDIFGDTGHFNKVVFNDTYSLYIGTLGSGSDVPESGGGGGVDVSSIVVYDSNGVRLGNGNTEGNIIIAAYPTVLPNPNSLIIGENIVYNGVNEVTISAIDLINILGNSLTTTNVPEGGNLYFTEARAISAVSSLKNDTTDRLIIDVITTTIADIENIYTENINGYKPITSGNISSQSVKYATSAACDGNGNSITDTYLAISNISPSISQNGLTEKIFITVGGKSSGAFTVPYAVVAGRVEWDNVEDAPTNLSEFNNDKGYITGIDKDMIINALGYTPLETDTDTWRPITNSYTGTSSTTSLSQKGANGMYNELLNGPANSLVSEGTTIVSVASTGATVNGALSMKTLYLPDASGEYTSFKLYVGTLGSGATIS